MLSLFPQILFLAPLSTALLRVCAGLVFVYLAYVHFSKRKAAAEELSTLIGGAHVIIPLYSVVELLIAVSLIAGVWTQLAALLGWAVALKVLFIRHSLRELKPLSQLSYALLAAICFSLVFTGAGAFAFDLPL